MEEQEQAPIADREFEEQLTELLKSVSYLDGDEREQMSLESAEVFANADVRSYEDGRVTFTDGSVSDYDLVVCATGFDVSQGLVG